MTDRRESLRLGAGAALAVAGLPADFAAVNGDEFVCYGNHEQYFFGDYFAHQPDYMEKELVAARLFRENGYSFCFMEELLGNGAR